MKKKMMKALRDLNDYIDNDREKLCDELHNVKLSHKRLERLLRLSLDWVKEGAYMYDSEGYYDTRDKMFSFISKVNHELSYPYLRTKWTIKGGKNG